MELALKLFEKIDLVNYYIYFSQMSIVLFGAAIRNKAIRKLEG